MLLAFRYICGSVFVAACANGCTHAQPHTSEEPAPTQTPELRFLHPSADEVVAGDVQIEIEAENLPEEAVFYWGVDEEELQPTKVIPSGLALRTSTYASGKHTLFAELHVGGTTILKASRALVFDNPDFEMTSYGLNRDAYRAGELLELNLEYSQAGLQLEPDLSALDSNFDPGLVEVTDNADNSYTVTYPISADSSAADGVFEVSVVAHDANGQSLQDTVSVRLRHKVVVPFGVKSAAFLDAEPPLLAAKDGFAALQFTSPPTPLLTGTTKPIVVTWDDTTSIDRLLVTAKGKHGYYVQAVAPGAHEATIELENLKIEVDGLLDVEFAAVDSAGETSGWQTTTIQVANVGLGGIQLTLFWDAPVDLDLSVIDPLEQLLDFETPSVNGGVLNLDANALCEMGPAFAENIAWISGKAPLGDYQVRVNLFDNCGYSGPINWWIVGVGGATSEESFKPGSGTASGVNLSGTINSSSEDESGAGMSAGPPVNVDVAQSVGGIIKFKAHPQTKFVDVPARFVPVHAESTVDGSDLGHTRTDNTGAYTIALNNPKDHDYKVVVEAVYQRSEAEAPLAQVLDQVGAVPYAVRSPLIKVAHGVSEVVNIGIKPADNSGAFNIVDNMRKAYDWVFARSASAKLGPLAARWTQGMASGTSYSRVMKRFQLSGSKADPDEFDDSVIIHEFMHYVYEQIVNKPTPGGTHTGAKAAPGQAFSEGLATALAQQILGNSIYLDKTNDNKKLSKTNIESNKSADAKGQGPAGQVSEYLVAMIVWDLFDAANETHDAISESSLTASTYLFDLGKRTDRGPTDMDLVDLLDGWRCRTGAVANASGAFRLDSELRKLLTERGYTYDFIGNPACPP